MPLDSGEDTNRSQSYFLELVDFLDKQGRVLAKDLHDARYIYNVFALLDGFSNSYSIFKYAFEICFATNNNELMHEFMISPEGIAIISSEILFLASFSFLASLFEHEKKGSTKKLIATAWPYFRDLMKGMKNAYRGWQSAIQIISLLGNADLKFMVVPIGLLLGVAAVACRWWIQHMREHRKELFKKNNALLEKILSGKASDETVLYQDKNERLQAFFIMGLNGFIDGLYLYVGVLNLALLIPPAFIAMTVVCCIYILANVVSRVYEEYVDQLELRIAQNTCKLAQVTKDLQSIYTNPLFLQKKGDKNPDDFAKIKKLQEQFCERMNRFDVLAQRLKNQTTHTYLTACLQGLRFGLMAYGVLTSCLFMVATLFLINAAIFSPVVLIAAISTGLVLMGSCTIYILSTHYCHVNKINSTNSRASEQLNELKNKIERGELIEPPSEVSLDHLLNEAVTLDASPKCSFQEWFDVFRSLCSGLPKGSSLVYFLGTLEPHDEVIMNVLRAAGAIIFGLALSLKALAKGLKEKQQMQSTPLFKVGSPEMGDSPRSSTQTEVRRESSEWSQSPPDSPSSPSVASFGIFQPKRNSVTQNPSINTLSDCTTQPGI
ncbi:MAG: hypothetical protein P4L65_05725 [Legionella sp.]|nr:hypothetical protein [Legionella sp.]